MNCIIVLYSMDFIYKGKILINISKDIKCIYYLLMEISSSYSLYIWGRKRLPWDINLYIVISFRALLS